MRNRYEKGTRLSERKYRQVLRLFATDITALPAAGLCALNYRTVHRLYSRWRQRIVDLALEELRPLAGEIEVDESFFGPRRVRGKRGRGAGGKTPVLGLHKRGERVFLSVVQNCSKQALMPILRGHVLFAKRGLYGWMDGLRWSGHWRV